ncbi:MAG TPA: DUF1501 domain-containing protein [Lacunisphaera sp.]|nr:DUF1501 domain-containing protein [Lacunisphaera sp.]
MSTSTAPQISRRQFLGQASCAGVGSTALFSTLLSLRLANSLAAQTAPTDYKAIVCLFLAGGNDSFNMLVPTTAGEYSAYAKVRGNLALARDTLLEITPGNLGGRTLGIHPSMPEVKALFNAGRLAFVSNVGSLVRPTTLADYKANRYRPVSLYSHADQIKQWQTCIPDQRTAIGWGGRAADILKSLNKPGLVSMNISLSGQNVFLTGENAFTYSVKSSGATPLAGYNPSTANNLTALRTAAANNMLDAEYRNLFEQSYGGSTASAVDAYYEFNAALTGINLTTTTIPANNSAASNLAMVARIAAANSNLGARRQVFFVQLGGWDHHDEVLNSQVNMLATVSKAVDTFWSALGEFGLQNNVTLFTASDFGRTLTSNGNGSDHAWGGNHLVMGGSVKGGNVYGDKDQGHYPDLQNLAAIDTGQGRLIPGVAVDEYAREMLSWFGVGSGDMDYVLPAFSSRFGGRTPLGFMGEGSVVASPTPTPTPTPTPPASGGGTTSGGTTAGGGGGGGAPSLGFLAAAGGLLALKKYADRRAKIRAKAVQAGT